MLKSNLSIYKYIPLGISYNNKRKHFYCKAMNILDVARYTCFIYKLAWEVNTQSIITNCLITRVLTKHIVNRKFLL